MIIVSVQVDKRSEQIRNFRFGHQKPSTGGGASCTASVIALGRVVGLTLTGPAYADESVTVPFESLFHLGIASQDSN
jgi:hypothetical protein